MLKLAQRTRVVAVAGATAMVLTGAACATGAESGSEAGSAEVRIWTFLDPDASADGRSMALQDIISNFEDANPGTTVVVEPQPFDELAAKYLSAVATGDEPDVMWLAGTSAPSFFDRGVTSDLRSLLGENVMGELLPDMTLPPIEVDDAVAALPIWPNAGYATLVRNDYLSTAGVTEPPTDWDEFVAYAANLTGDGAYGYGLFSQGTTESMLFNVVAGAGKEAWDETWDEGKFNFSSNASVRAAETIRELVITGAAASDNVNSSVDDIHDQFLGGRYAMISTYAPRYDTITESAPDFADQLTLAGLPSYDGNPTPVVADSWSIVASATPSSPEATASFIEALYTPESSLIWSKVGGQLPDRSSTLSDPYFETPEAATLALFSDLLADADIVTFPTDMQNSEQVFRIANVAVQQLIGSDRPVEEILTEAYTTAYE